MWRRGFGGRLVLRVGCEQAFPDKCLTLPEEALAVFVHLRPEANLVQRAVELDVVLRALDEHNVAVPRAANALVANGFPGDLHVREKGEGRRREPGDGRRETGARIRGQ